MSSQIGSKVQADKYPASDSCKTPAVPDDGVGYLQKSCGGTSPLCKPLYSTTGINPENARLLIIPCRFFLIIIYINFWKTLGHSNILWWWDRQSCYNLLLNCFSQYADKGVLCSWQCAPLSPWEEPQPFTNITADLDWDLVSRCKLEGKKSERRMDLLTTSSFSQ